MTQPHLLELAKQGDPQAIATLINVTLEPQGVTAQAFAEVDCLYIFLKSARPLNAKTLVTFVQRGILRLEVVPIRQVQVYGQRLGEEQPAWSETFTVSRSQTADALEALSHPSVHPSDAHISKPASVVRSSNGLTGEAWRQQWLALQPHFQAALQFQVASLQPSLSSVAAAKQRAARWWRDRCLQEQGKPIASSASVSKKRSVNYLKLSALVTLLAFVTGGAVALIANSYTLGNSERKVSSERTMGGKPFAIAAGSQMSLQSSAEHTRDQQQSAAKSYLETMNKAQQSFYRQHQRFAATLEELERFAAVSIAVRSDYSYKLTVPSNTQSQLTAIPKADGLRSYTAAASIAKPTNRVITAICASPQAAKVPPLVFQSTNGAVQCPAESAKAL